MLNRSIQGLYSVNRKYAVWFTARAISISTASPQTSRVFGLSWLQSAGRGTFPEASSVKYALWMSSKGSARGHSKLVTTYSWGLGRTSAADFEPSFPLMYPRTSPIETTKVTTDPTRDT